ncbi:GSCOCT00014095001.2-RA-CDS [Cotesia congregata]|uniref:Cc_odve66_19 n=1 Tax=Cotesia congregata TaxID=51543 RepID=A0A8J2H6I7_COTCN|nr:GSCOCT00014095001.2-RA-CDS [Cotesia congregata]CAG5078899.1 Cc_odve66_19 [Cotesia congregata]
MEKSNAKYLIILLIFIASLITFMMIWLRRWSIPIDDTIKAVRESLKLSSTTLSFGEKEKTTIYKDREDKFSEEQFSGWDNDSDKLTEFARFGVKLLDFCATYSSSYWENYQTIVTNMVETLIARLEKANPKKQEFEKAPWGENRFAFFALVTRFLAMYEYVGEEDYLKWKCHDQLMMMVPTIGRALHPIELDNDEGMNLLYQAVPRLCSNYMFDREEYQRDLVNPNFIKLKKFMSFERVLQERPPTDGIYRDDSWVVNGNVPSYSALLRFYNYHERVYQALGFKTPIREIAKSVLEKLMHPKIKYQPLGLVNNLGEVFNDRLYWNIVPSANGVNIMPFMGLAVFKTDVFLFHVRVQRPQLAAFEIEEYVDVRLGIGALQMRKIYLANGRYNKIFKWDDLKRQPGMMSWVNEAKDVGKELKLDKNFKIKSIYTRQGDIASYIGRLEDKLIFWYNYYYFGLYRAFVTEIGVVTSNGVQIYHKINRESVPADDLQLAFKDDEGRLSCEVTSYTTCLHDQDNGARTTVNVAREDKFITCKAGNLTIVQWKMMLHNSPDNYEVKIISTGFSFKYNKVNYNGVFLEKGRYYVHNGTSIVMGGSSSSDPNDSFTSQIYINSLNKNYKFTRDSKTMMYNANVVN